MRLTGMSEFCDRLKSAREAKGLGSAREAADWLPVSYPTYAAHENGGKYPSRDNIEKYARRFGVSVDWLITGRNTGISESSVSTAIAYLFRAIPSDQLADMNADDVAEIVVAVGKAVEAGKSKDEIVANVISLFAEKMRRAG
ncbi:helix-turn-helix domain-containing protein [uncultured Roseobacter sp.]|uniref:helix-turn-helix domain-containing protein n=1 Tax=uncultured Roseobacter sp. TaxID=114847 RepID=UPI0026074FEB|nr:helix-turn-helix transcriptional regulator [uncultured Roseobacter sp.]